MDINATCLGPKQNCEIQLSVILKVLYQKKKKKVLDFSKIEYYKEVLGFRNNEYYITFLTTSRSVMPHWRHT